MEHLTASTSPIPISGEDWFDPLEEAIRFRVRAFIEALAEVDCKTTGTPAEAVCGQALMALNARAGRQQRA